MNRFFLAIIMIICTGLGFYIVSQAHSANYIDPTIPDCYTKEECDNIKAWYREAKQPKLQGFDGWEDYLVSCCGEADAYWVKFSVEGDKVFATVTDEREVLNRVKRNGQKFEILSYKFDNRHQGNPTGHDIVFIGSGNQIYCVFPNADY